MNVTAAPTGAACAACRRVGFVQPDQACAPVTVRDHIAARLAGSRQGCVNVSAVREAARVQASRD